MSPLPPPPPAPPDEPDPALGRVVRQLREERGLSRIELANRSGVDETALAQIEAGAIDPPWTTVEAIARGLEVSVQSIASAVVAQDPERP
jgi:transcriptional regulator with XRE-family HTH domain